MPVVAAKSAESRGSRRVEDAAALGDAEGRLAIAATDGEDHLALPHQRVHVVDIAGNELLQQVVRLLVAQFVEGAPDTLAVVELADADGPGLEARLQHPRRRHGGHVLAQPVVVEDAGESGHADAGRGGGDAHGQFVAEAARRRFAQPLQP